MGFCTKCGAALDANGVCPNCGPEVVNGTVELTQQVYQGQALSLRGQSLSQMDQMLRYFGEKQDAYDRYDEADAALDKWEFKSYTPLLVIGIIATFVGLVALLAESYGFGIITFLVGGGLIALFVLGKKKKKKMIEENTVKLTQANEELVAHYNGYFDCPVGMEYTNPKILSVVQDTIRSGRAETPSQAINVMLDDAHKAEMEQMAQQTLEAAEQTAKNTKKAAKYAKRSSFWSAADFFLK